MESLQIQDAFAPYYVDRKAKSDKTAKRGETTSLTVHASDIRTRLEACRNRLARAIAAAEAERR
ncbi:hypothetical protein ACSBOB_13675 [Mesorhizobium sp. ASY16-5R]|uniref:hypothetical protein n=1 Tax=Mesorhizobium sp. ASY16-5R TaxID=3445772 RepID=UPI003FA00C6D